MEDKVKVNTIKIKRLYCLIMLIFVLMRTAKSAILSENPLYFCMPVISLLMYMPSL